MTQRFQLPPGHHPKKNFFCKQAFQNSYIYEGKKVYFSKGGNLLESSPILRRNIILNNCLKQRKKSTTDYIYMETFSVVVT